MHRALYLAAHAGVRIQIVHVSSPVSADLVRARSARAGPVTMEICPHHLLLDLDDLVRLGPYGVCAPALRDRALVERLWDVRARRHRRLPDLRPQRLHAARRRTPGYDDIFDAPLGCQVIQETVPLVLDEAFHRRGMPLDAFVRFSSTNAARIAGLYPRKGTLLPGADADIAIYDLETRVGGRRAQPAVLQEPVVAVRRPPRCGPASCARSCAARRCTPTARSSPSPAQAASCPATTTTRWRARAKSRGAERVPAGASQSEHRRASHRGDARCRAGGAAGEGAR